MALENRYFSMQQETRGTLTFNIYAVELAKPISNAKIEIFEGDNPDNVTKLEELITNSSGQTAEITLPAPPVDYTLTPTPSERPYSTYTARITAEGYEPMSVAGIQVFNDSIGIQDANLNLQIRKERQSEIIVIEPHTLWGTFPPKIPEDEIKPEPPATGFVVLDQPVIPEFIIVHDGSPNDPNAPNYYIRFKDYIKNVASSEIYSTWPEQTIQANILAILSFTLNRVFTEWYRSKGKNFTITSSTEHDNKW